MIKCYFFYQPSKRGVDVDIKRIAAVVGAILLLMLLTGGRPDEEKTRRMVLDQHRGSVLYVYTGGRTLNYLLCTERGEVKFVAVTPSTIMGTRIDHAELLNHAEIKCVPAIPAKNGGPK